MYGGMSQDFPADSLASGKEDIIKMLIQQAGVLCPSAGNDGDKALVKTVADDPSYDRSEERRVGKECL